MKFIKKFICNYLCTIYLSRKNNFFDTTKIILPNKYYSFKNSKQYLFSNNIYFDIYLDSINKYNTYNIKKYTLFNNVIKKDN